MRFLFLHLVFTCGISLSLCLPCFAEKALSVTIIDQQPHDSRLFTQGFAMHQGKIYESSGLYGKSFIRRYDSKTQKIEKQRRLPNHFFAEGLTHFQDRIFLLTWKAGTALVLNSDSLQVQKKLSYSGEGWGLTHSDTELIMSDGSDRLSFRNPSTFKLNRSISVHNKWRRYKYLNELEYAESAIWANVWQSNLILKISPKDGSVLGVADLSTLVKKNSPIKNQKVLNGIAYDPDKKAFWITGKFWPSRYLVRFE